MVKMEMKIYLTNLGKYNEGELVGKWFTLPICIEEALKEIGVANGTQYEEYFITDYENDLGLKIDEYESLDKLNKIAYYIYDKNMIEVYSDIACYFDNHEDFYPIEDLDDMLHGISALDIANMIHFGSYNPNHDYFKFDGYGNIETLSDYELEAMKLDTITENIEQYVQENF